MMQPVLKQRFDCIPCYHLKKSEESFCLAIQSTLKITKQTKIKTKEAEICEPLSSITPLLT